MEWADEVGDAAAGGGGGRDGGPTGSSRHSMSEQLASFTTDFESKILRPVREKRAAGDEILAIQPVALGVSTAMIYGK